MAVVTFYALCKLTSLVRMTDHVLFPNVLVPFTRDLAEVEDMSINRFSKYAYYSQEVVNNP